MCESPRPGHVAAALETPAAVPISDPFPSYQPTHTRAPPPSSTPRASVWACAQCTLENSASAAVCAACEAPNPSAPVARPQSHHSQHDDYLESLPQEDDYEEQLALALAMSAQIARGEGASAAPAPAPPASSFGLRMAQAAEAQAVRDSEAEEQARLRSRVDSSLLRVAGDAKGTASTLVGLTPEEAEELVMLQSRVAAERPPERPKAHQLVGQSGGGGPPTGVTTPALGGHLAPLGPLPALSGGALSGGALAAGALAAGCGQLPSAAPAGRAAPKAAAGRAKKAVGGATGLQESLLGGDHLEDDVGLAPLQMPALAPLHVPSTTPAAPGFVPVVAPMVAPAAVAPVAPTAPSPPIDEAEWDDADRPLQLSQLPRPPPQLPTSSSGNVWGV